jgi:hypothetical protein
VPGTPRRIVFAPNQESYAASKPPSEVGEFDRQKARGKRRRADKKGKGKGGDKDTNKEEEGGWWVSWILGAAGARSAMKEEERLGKAGWGRPNTGFGGGGMDDWGV